MTLDADRSDDAQPLVTCHVDAHVALISWNRPHRNNAWTPELEASYFGLLRAAAAEPDIRVIVVTGTGKHFCPGADSQNLSHATEGDHRFGPENRPPQTFPMTIPKPIIAAIHGSCAGTGFLQACFCDIRFAEADARLTPAFARRGIMAEHGIGFLLPALIGTSHALDILMSARVLSGEETARMGLTKLSAPGRAIDDALGYARDLAVNCSPQAMAITKRQVYETLREPLERSRLEAIEYWRRLREHGDFAEGVRSYLDRRPPGFAALDGAELAAIMNAGSAEPWTDQAT